MYSVDFVRKVILVEFICIREGSERGKFLMVVMINMTCYKRI